MRRSSGEFDMAAVTPQSIKCSSNSYTPIQFASHSFSTDVPTMVRGSQFTVLLKPLVLAHHLHHILPQSQRACRSRIVHMSSGIHMHLHPRRISHDRHLAHG